MGRARQTVERLQLGLALLRLRNQTKKSQQEAGTAIDRTAGRLSQVENGRGALGARELGKLLDFYGATGEEREMVLALGRASRRREPRRGYVDTLPEPFQRLVELQSAADKINWYECGVVPGLVQSPDYVRAIMRNGDSIYWDSSEEETSERIAFRLGHQRRVLETTAPKKINIVFTEDTLHHDIGGAAVMRGQVLHLLQLVERHPTLSVEVVPTAAPDNPALGGGIIALDFDSGPTITFASVLHGPYTYYDQGVDTEPMRRIFHRVRELALSPEDTRNLLIGMLKES